VFPDGYGHNIDSESSTVEQIGASSQAGTVINANADSGSTHPSTPFSSCVRESARSFLAGENRAASAGQSRPRPFRSREAVGHWSSRSSLLLRVTAQFSACPQGTMADGAPDDVTDDDLADDGLQGRRMGSGGGAQFHGVDGSASQFGSSDEGVTVGRSWWASWLHVLAACALAVCMLQLAMAGGAVVRAASIGCWAAEAAEALPLRWAARARLVRAVESRGWSKLRGVVGRAKAWQAAGASHGAADAD